MQYFESRRGLLTFLAVYVRSGFLSTFERPSRRNYYPRRPRNAGGEGSRGSFAAGKEKLQH